jgi:hypothetical protein
VLILKSSRSETGQVAKTAKVMTNDPAKRKFYLVVRATLSLDPRTGRGPAPAGPAPGRVARDSGE